MEAIADTGSAPVDTGSVGTAEPSPSSSSYPSDDQILSDVGEDSPAETPTDDSAAPQAAAPEVKQDPAAATAPKEEAVDPALEASLSEERKQAFKRDPALRDAFYREAAYKQIFPTVQEARELRQLFPTPELAREAANHSAALAQIDDAFRNNPSALVAQLNTVNPQAFAGLLADIRHSAYGVNPDAYRENIGKPAVYDYLDNLADEAVATGNEDLKTVVDFLNAKNGRSRQAAPQAQAQADDPRLQRLEELERREQEAREGALRSFSTSVDQGFNNGLASEIASHPALGNVAANAETKTRIQNEIAKAVYDKMNADPRLWQGYQSRKQNGDYSQAHMDAAKSYAMSFARQYLPDAVRSVMAYWTPILVQSNADARAKTAAAPKPKDVGSGNAVGSKGNGGLPRDENGRFVYRKKDGSQLSDNDILNL